MSPDPPSPMPAASERRVVVALAGRRIDSHASARPRFPLSRLVGVREEIRRTLLAERAGMLVAAAACGADLLALEVAGELGIRRRIVLPDQPARFRKSSVIDRPGDWAASYDRLIAEVAQRDDLVVIDQGPGALPPDYFQTNLDILDEAVRQAASLDWPLRVVVVWDGRSRGPDDVTAHFLAEARRRTIPVTEVLTIAH